MANRITDVEMIPRFKEGKIVEGLVAGISVLQKLSLQEFTASDYIAKNKRGKKKSIPFILIPLILFIFISAVARRRRPYNSRSDLPFWLALWGANSLGRRNSGGWGDFSSGSGGFGGFGGGSFGGGGAGGSW